MGGSLGGQAGGGVPPAVENVWLLKFVALAEREIGVPHPRGEVAHGACTRRCTRRAQVLHTALP